MSKDEEQFKEWLELSDTKAFLNKLNELEIDKLRAIVVNSNKEEACGIVKGIALVKSLLESAKKEGL